MALKTEIADISGGANQARVRAHNERLVLSLVRRHGSLSKAEIARRSGLSPQTVTIIMRALEKDGLLLRGQPIRGKVGQPSIPMSLDPQGAFSFGLKIGRRSVDLILMDFTGQIRDRLHETYTFPTPGQIERFVTAGVARLTHALPEASRQRIAGLGVAMPFELWSWADTLGVQREDMEAWRTYDVTEALAEATGLPVLLQNDGTAAAGAELLFGNGRSSADFAYLFIGHFIGGGLVIDSTLYSGPSGSAGGFGTIRVGGKGGERISLLNGASLHLLETALSRSGGDPGQLWDNPENWSVAGPALTEWVNTTAGCIAEAIVSTLSIIDFPQVIIDGNLPGNVRTAVVRATRSALEGYDLSGIRPFEVSEGVLGHNAKVLGGGSLPIMARYLVDNKVLFTSPATA
ncbi:ROK family transcriptional regulator [Oceanibium sediminis]|uniref:ROK family transcriptional regulator n=1 Tax=Oceanibium sediminis TaxID=2026339 RepID=UPI000DD2D026|nr:ROK family transcriptional regulator [Oceanibium sediminis]